VNFIFDPSLVLYLPMYELNGSSFMSRDAYGHLCTVTGALWRPDGRYFDGSDDRINLGAVLVPASAETTWEVWAKRFSGSATNQVLIGQMSPIGGIWKVYGEGLYFDGTSVYLESENNNDKSELSGTVSDTNWHHIVGITGIVAGALFIDSILVDSGDLDSGRGQYVLAIGAAGYTPGTPTWGKFFKGWVGEVRIYERALSAVEIQHNYLATKWRYQ